MKPIYMGGHVKQYLPLPFHKMKSNQSKLDFLFVLVKVGSIKKYFYNKKLYKGTY